jgi:hypothetical protein
VSAKRIKMKRKSGIAEGPTLADFNMVRATCETCCICGAEPTHVGIRSPKPEEALYFNVRWCGFALCRRCFKRSGYRSQVKGRLTRSLLRPNPSDF